MRRAAVDDRLRPRSWPQARLCTAPATSAVTATSRSTHGPTAAAAAPQPGSTRRGARRYTSRYNARRAVQPARERSCRRDSRHTAPALCGEASGDQRRQRLRGDGAHASEKATACAQGATRRAAESSQSSQRSPSPQQSCTAIQARRLTAARVSARTSSAPHRRKRAKQATRPASLSRARSDRQAVV